MGLFENSVSRMECSDEKENEKVRTGGSGDGAEVEMEVVDGKA